MIQVDSLRFPANIPTGETLLVMYVARRPGDEEGRVAGHRRPARECSSPDCGTAWGGFPRNSTSLGGCGGVALGKLTLSLEPSLIFIGIGALFGIKVGLSMLLGLVLNYGILAPRLIEAKVIQHPPPKIKAVADAATAAGGQGRADVRRPA